MPTYLNTLMSLLGDDFAAQPKDVTHGLAVVGCVEIVEAMGNAYEECTYKFDKNIRILTAYTTVGFFLDTGV
jgi:hypothetical protein